MRRFKIGRRTVGDECPCFIVAEAGINHNGSLKTAKEMIAVAKGCGADAIKFQTFKAEEFVSDPKETYSYKTQERTVKESMLAMFKRYELGIDDYRAISDYCRKLGMIFFSTPQNAGDLKILLDLDVPAVKVGSDDLTNIPLLEFYARQKLPMIISTGMSYINEVEDAVNAIKRYNDKLAVLHCVSSYPADYGELNLARIKTLQSRFPGEIIGFSNHSAGIAASIAAVAIGAKIIEKHFTLDKKMKGPDHQFSMDPEELNALVREIRSIEMAIGTGKISPSKNEMKMRKLCRRSVVAARDIEGGEILKEKDLVVKRPGTGILPKDMRLLIDRKAKKDIKKDKMISFGDLI